MRWHQPLQKPVAVRSKRRKHEQYVKKTLAPGIKPASIDHDKVIGLELVRRMLLSPVRSEDGGQAGGKVNRN